MKKMLHLLTVLLLTAAIISCDKETTTEMDGIIPKAYVLNSSSKPVSAVLLVTPAIIGADKPKGGNVSCADVADAYGTTFDKCGAKLNYGDFDEDGDYEFDGVFDGVEVVVTNGTYVGFTIPTTTGTCYKVGAVIVKGGNSANVYYYPDGATHDNGLASPINSSGSPAGLSNLTFCFFESQAEPIVVAVKAFFTAGSNYTVFPGEYSYATSDGAYIFNPDSPEFDPFAGWCEDLGINYYPEKASFSILGAATESYPGIRETVGTVTIWEEGDNMKVKISLKPTGGILGRTYLYVGDLQGIYDSGLCPAYTSAPWTMLTPDPTDLTTVLFTVPYPYN